MSLRSAPSLSARAASMLWLPDALVRDLTIAAGSHRTHDQLFGRHERQLVGEAAPDARRMHLESARDVLHQDTRIASVARKLSGITRRRFALSSSVRSKNCTLCV